MRADIRPAVPGDVREVTRLMYLAGRSHLEKSIYDLMFAASPAHIYDQLGKVYLASIPSMYHYSHYLVAEVDGRVAGSLCGYHEATSGGRKVREALEEIGWGASDLRAWAERMRPFLRVYPLHPKDAWVVENVAVFPAFRRRGLISSLLEEVLERGRRTGCRHAELGMLIGNTPAQRAYEKAGFVTADEYTDPEFEALLGSPGMVRMVARL